MKRLLALVFAVLAATGTGLNCKKTGDYTVLVDREDSMFVTKGGYTGFQSELEAGDQLKAEFQVLEGGGPIDFLVLSDSALELWESNQEYDAVIEVSNSAGSTKTGAVQTAGDYWIVASNRDDSTAARKVSYEVWRKKR